MELLSSVDDTRRIIPSIPQKSSANQTCSEFTRLPSACLPRRLESFRKAGSPTRQLGHKKTNGHAEEMHCQHFSSYEQIWRVPPRAVVREQAPSAGLSQHGANKEAPPTSRADKTRLTTFNERRYLRDGGETTPEYDDSCLKSMSKDYDYLCKDVADASSALFHDRTNSPANHFVTASVSF
eukprot:7515014-Pyramimonas_sp.AAC.1